MNFTGLLCHMMKISSEETEFPWRGHSWTAARTTWVKRNLRKAEHGARPRETPQPGGASNYRNWDLSKSGRGGGDRRQLWLCLGEGCTDKSTAERGPRGDGNMPGIKGMEREPPIQGDSQRQRGPVRAGMAVEPRQVRGCRRGMTLRGRPKHSGR